MFLVKTKQLNKLLYKKKMHSALDLGPWSKDYNKNKTAGSMFERNKLPEVPL
jgi:hypothetical protein